MRSLHGPELLERPATRAKLARPASAGLRRLAARRDLHPARGGLAAIHLEAMGRPRATRRAMARRRASAGFSLIEILVAVLIISVGVLGVAGLQLVSLQNNTSAMFRTQAFQSAYEIIDRKRANPDQDYSIALADPIPAAPPDCEGADCTPAQMRTYDLATWLTDLDGPPNGLPGGDGEVVDAGGVITVTVQWRDERDPAALPLSVDVTTTL